VSGTLSACVSSGAAGVIQNVSNGVDAVGVTLVVGSDGTYSMTGTAGGNWINPPSTTIAAQWEVKIDATAGAFTSGTTGTWLAASGSPGWIEDSGTVTFDISWRDAATQTVRKVQTGVTMQKL
jgi:hypothetical protein